MAVIKTQPVYNLEFPAFCNKLTIFGYEFKRVRDYESRVKKLHRRGGSFHEFKLEQTTGRHSITGVVVIPSKEFRCKLPWAQKDSTALADVILLLNLFTSRDVFSFAEEELVGAVLQYDPRSYAVANMLRVALKYRKGVPNEYGFAPNMNFEIAMNDSVKLIRSREWQRQYKRGYVLFLARQAFKYQTTESSLIACFTIWEHVFALFHPQFTEQQLQIAAVKKIAYLLHEFKFVDKPLSHNQQTRLQKQIIRLRNKVVHYGRIPSRQHSQRDAWAFIELTSHLTARILNLMPGDSTGCIKRIKHVIGKL